MINAVNRDNCARAVGASPAVNEHRLVFAGINDCQYAPNLFFSRAAKTIHRQIEVPQSSRTRFILLGMSTTVIVTKINYCFDAKLSKPLESIGRWLCATIKIFANLVEVW